MTKVPRFNKGCPQNRRVLNSSNEQSCAAPAPAAMPTGCRLRPLGDNAGQPVELGGRSTTLGRAEDNDVQAAPRSVSGYHAELELLDGGGAVLHDRGADGAGSRFGSFVGERHFLGGWREVRHGDILRLGTLQHGVAFRYEEDSGAPLPPPPRPETFLEDPNALQNAAGLRNARARDGERPPRSAPPAGDDPRAAGLRSPEDRRRRDVPVSVSYAVADGVRTDDGAGRRVGFDRRFRGRARRVRPLASCGPRPGRAVARRAAAAAPALIPAASPVRPPPPELEDAARSAARRRRGVAVAAEAEVERLRAQVASLTGDLAAAADADAAAARAELRELSRAVAELVPRVGGLAGLQGQIDDLRTELRARPEAAAAPPEDPVLGSLVKSVADMQEAMKRDRDERDRNATRDDMAAMRGALRRRGRTTAARWRRAAAVKDQLATYLADLRDEASGGDQDAAEVRAELRALQLSIAEMREESPRPDLPAEAPTPAMLEIQRELGHLSEQLKQAMPSPNTAHRRASFQVMKAELDQLKSAQRNAPDAAEMLKETMRDYVDQIRGDAAEGDREIIRAELGTLADRLSEVTAAQQELLSPRERAADPALLELSDQLAQLRRDMVTQQQQQRRPSSSSQRPSMVALREDVEALRSRHEAAPREALDAVRGDFQRFVEELRSDFTRTSTDERDAMRVELVKAELADLKRRKNSEHLSADALDAVQGNLKSYVDDLRRDMVASGDRDEMRGELHALQLQIAQLAASPRLAEAPVPSAASLEARIQPFLAEQLAPVLAELRKPPPVVQLQLPQQQTERPGRRSSLASVKADLAQLRHNQHDRVSKESIVRSVQSGLETYVKDLRADASAAATSGTACAKKSRCSNER
ncbi:hypothetical protein JL721_2231 [Aureococcus anophagefferens]|nr:hypothetical protein JL721_2231 [Aureococcus anophagefferens]